MKEMAHISGRLLIFPSAQYKTTLFFCQICEPSPCQNGAPMNQPIEAEGLDWAAIKVANLRF